MATSRGQRVILADFTALTSSARVSWFLLRLGLIHSRGRFVYVAITWSPDACDGAPVGFLRLLAAA